MMSIVRTQQAFIRPKERGRICEDVILRCRRHARYAISDGASTSYDSRGWARSLCRQFFVNQNLNVEWLYAARRYFENRAPPSEDDWAASHAADRGSYATFLGLTITDLRIVAHAIGDSVLFLIRQDGYITMFPEMISMDFARDPVLLCSKAGRGAFPDTEEAFGAAECAIYPPPGGWSGTRVVAVTDALAEWVVRKDDPQQRLERLNEIAAHQDVASFDLWAGAAISAGDIRRDDCAALILGL